MRSLVGLLREQPFTSKHNHSFTPSLAAPFYRDSLEIRIYSSKLTALGCYAKKDNSHSQSFFIRYVELSVAEEEHSMDLNCPSLYQYRPGQRRVNRKRTYFTLGQDIYNCRPIPIRRSVFRLLLILYFTIISAVLFNDSTI